MSDQAAGQEPEEKRKPGQGSDQQGVEKQSSEQHSQEPQQGVPESKREEAPERGVAPQPVSTRAGASVAEPRPKGPAEDDSGRVTAEASGQGENKSLVEAPTAVTNGDDPGTVKQDLSQTPEQDPEQKWKRQRGRRQEPKAAAKRQRRKSAREEQKASATTEKAPKEKRGRRRSLHIVARTGVSVAVIALLPASVWAALVVPQLGISATPASVVVQPAASLRDLVCSGAARTQTDANATSAGGVLGSASVTAASGAASGVRITGLGGAIISQNAGADGAGLSTALATDLTTGALVSAPDGTASDLVGAVQAEQLSSSDASGYAATNCVRSTSDAWIVGGETTTGRVSIVHLLNSSSSIATVTISPFTDSGAGTLSQVTVPAGGEVSVPLSALVPGASTLAVHVTSMGAAVSAYLQETSVDALTPSGFDVWSYGADPSTSVVIPGIAVTGRGASVRLISAYTTTAQVTVLSSNGSAGASLQVSLKANQVTDVSLAGLADDVYVASISADEPVAAAAVQSNASGSGSVDFGWIASASASSVATVFAVPALSVSGQTATLTMYPTASGTVTVTDASGKATPLTVTGQTPASLALDAGGYTLSSDIPVAAAVTITGGGTSAAYPVSVPASGVSAITVFP